MDKPFTSALPEVLARPAQPDFSGQLARLRAQRSAIFIEAFESGIMQLNAELKAWSQNTQRSTGEIVAIALAILVGAFVMAAALYWAGDALLGAFDG